MAVVSLFVSSATQAITNRTDNSSIASSGLLEIGFLGLSCFVSVVGLGLALKTYKSTKTSIGQTVDWALEHFLIYMGYFIVFVLVIVAGFVALVIPGILFALWFSLAIIVKFDEGGTIRQVLARSRYLVRGRLIEVVAVIVSSVLCTAFGLLGSGAQNAVMVEYYHQLKKARDSDHELPPISRQSWMLTIGFVILLGLLIFAIVTSGLKIE